MPRRPLRPCAHPGCRALVDRGRCELHERQQRRAADRHRGSARARGYDWQWDKDSKAFLREHPLCYYCGLLGRITAARCVDHATPHRGDEQLLRDRSNWRSACIECNSSKGDDDEPTFLARIGVDVARLARG